MLEHRARSGEHLSAGNFYRELAKLAEDGLAKRGTCPPDVDQRRVPYSISDKGSATFDEWLAYPVADRDEITRRLVFADRIPVALRKDLFERWQEDLWIEGKQLVRAREDALAKRRARPRNAYDPLPALLNRQISKVFVEVKFLNECLRELNGDPPSATAADRQENGGTASVATGPRTARSASGKKL